MGDEIPRSFREPARAEWAARWHELRSDHRVGAALLACVALAAAFAWFRAGASSSSALPAPASTSFTDGTNARTTTTLAATGVVVDVVGAVRHGGVVRLHAGARVVDAIAAAGGATADADVTPLNLAAVLVDGARVAVPRLGAAAPAVDPTAVSGAPDSGAGGEPTPGAPVDLNTATAAQLDTLPGVGPATATAIINDRTANGPFKSVNDLGRVRGIGNAKLDQLRPLVTV